VLSKKVSKQRFEVLGSLLVSSHTPDVPSRAESLQLQGPSVQSVEVNTPLSLEDGPSSTITTTTLLEHLESMQEMLLLMPKQK
jgi:hypothetical protein